MEVAPVTREILERLAYLGRLRKLALAAFGPGEPDDRLRASLVSGVVSSALDVEDSGYFRRDLAMALEAAGWRSVNLQGRRHWKGMRAR